MGAHKNITATGGPKQTPMVGKQTKVCFHYNAEAYYHAEIVRDDAESPFVTILKLSDGRHLLATECMYSYPN